jgi:hypothetical protein
MADEATTRSIDEREARLLESLVLMVDRNLERRPDGLVDSYAMSAPEGAIAVLAEYSLIELVIVGRQFGRWTDAGEEIRKTASDKFPDHPDQRLELPAEYEEYGRIIERWAALGEKAQKTASDRYPGPDQRLELPGFGSSDETDIGELVALNIGDREGRLLEALLYMIDQFLPWRGPAVAALAEYGLMEQTVSGPHSVRLTKLGRKFWRALLRAKDKSKILS